MIRTLYPAFAVALMTTAGLVPARALSEEGPPPGDDAVAVDLSGAYSIWGLTQRGFLLGQDHPLNDAAYVVQNFRLGLKVSNSHVGGQLRLDAAQGWWGVDNSPDVQQVTTADADGTLTTAAQYNPYALFEDKDTNYAVHVDTAFIHFAIPHIPARVEVGRRYVSVGNKLVLDYDYDGLGLVVEPAEGLAISGLWAKMSEGLGSYKSPVGALMSDDDLYADADLYGGVISYHREGVSAEVFGLHYRDRIPDHAYLPQGLGYAYSRFQPQVATATALGVALAGEVKLAGGLSWKAEGDYLLGTDDLDNADYAGNLIDINDGTLRGFNALVDVTQRVEAGVPLRFGLLLGVGSGDDDPTSGPGNINRIQTMGIFPLTNVWEDSVMPDIEGISPQGLGSPVSRGYRELENTTAAQVRVGVSPASWLALDLSYTWLHATRPIHGWDAAGPTAETSSAIGQEIDANLTVKVWKELSYKALYGYFIPSEGAGLLIRGTAAGLQPAWELKQVLMFQF